MLTSGGPSALALWSSEFAATRSDDRIAITDGAGAVLAAEGESGSFSGGSYGPENLDFVEDLVGEVPADCQRMSYYLVAHIPSSE